MSYISAGLTAQFGEGILPGFEPGDDTRYSYIYREHFLDVTAGYGNFSLWTNLEFSSPPQIGPGQMGLRKLRLLWETDSYSISMGDLFGQIGRGLALNMWESQGIDWDSSLRGIWLRTKPVKNWALGVISGKVRSGRYLPLGPGINPRSRDFSDFANVNAAVISRENLYPGLTIGSYLTSAKAFNPWFSKTRSYTGQVEVMDSTRIVTKSWIPGFFAEHFGHNYDLYMEFIFRSHEIIDADSLFSSTLFKWLRYDKRTEGWGGYISFSLYPGNWGFTVEYKNYAYDFSDPDKRLNLPYRLGRSSPVQAPPTVFREHSSALLSRTPHVMDFEDEIGVQVEINYQVNPNLFFLFNYSQSSRHTGFTKTIRSDFTTEWKMEKIPLMVWMDTDEKYYPFREIYGELNYYFEPLNLDFRGMVSAISEIISYDASLTDKAGVSAWLSQHSKAVEWWENRNLFTIPLEMSMNLFSGLGLTIKWEHQWEDLQFKTYIAFENRETGRIDSTLVNRTVVDPYYNRYTSITIGKPSRFSFSIIYDFASKVKTGQSQNIESDFDSWLETILRRSGIDLKNKWLGLQLTTYLTPSTMLSLFYGSLQGGLKCDSGVCVYVPGIEDAFTVKFTSNF